ncbi:MAG TPA: Trm112 family protein [Myxococcales bacterium]|nr:Trm112 family protein [Myxococcales bacterium]
MPIAPELKEILACPKCKGELEFREEQQQIVCKACKLVYRIEDDIPVMLIDEATPLTT